MFISVYQGKENEAAAPCSCKCTCFCTGMDESTVWWMDGFGEWAFKGWTI